MLVKRSALVVLVALVVLFLPAARLASAQVGGCAFDPTATLFLWNSYPAGASYSFVPPASACLLFAPAGSGSYGISTTSGTFVYTGDIYHPRAGVVGLVTTSDVVEVWQQLPAPTATIAPSITPTVAGLPYGCTMPVRDGLSWSFVGSDIWSFIATGEYSMQGVYLEVPDNSQVQITYGNWSPPSNGGQLWNLWTLDGFYYHENTYGGGIVGTEKYVNFPTGGTVDIGTYAGTGYSTDLEVCIFLGVPAVITTPTATLSPTASPVITRTPLPTPLPSQGVCSSVSVSPVGPDWFARRNGDLFGYTFRITTPLVENAIDVTAVAVDGTTVHLAVDHNGFVGINAHTVYVEWRDGDLFGLQLCTGVPVVPTATTAPVFGTPTAINTATSTATATATPTGTLLPTNTSTPSATPTVAPTATINPTCLTPESEDSGECTLIDLEGTQIALLQTVVAPVATPGALTPVVTGTPEIMMFSTAFAAICERDPCYNLVRMNETVQGSLAVMTNVDNSVCAAPSFPFAFGVGLFGIGNYMTAWFPTVLCWVIDTTESVRTIMRFLTSLAVFFLLYKYYIRTFRRLGDV